MTPWSTEAEAVIINDESEEVGIRLSLLLSTDLGPMRSFRHFLDVDLDEAHATELLGKLTLAFRDLRNRKAEKRTVQGGAKIPPYVQAAAEAPLRDRPNHLEAEIHFVAERERCSLFSAALEQFSRKWTLERELAL